MSAQHRLLAGVLLLTADLPLLLGSPIRPPSASFTPWLCSACFDFEFYKAHNPDLPVWGPETIWEHFVTSGQHEGRVFRCGQGRVRRCMDELVKSVWR
jgi:hypothetical protein